ncbi:MAG TPA: polyhydroxyalkanoate synthesis regulator DNA-binding domain-containing protein [Acidobacteriaceae bacterium]|nr:polyhydroxyalkanoate synthesis regulator DNA-binding domain-containing protein [Acidobacteriaceae bacterium]
MPPKSILIKKYENRRLYDVTNSRYVNLEEVAQLLREGHDVRVVDAASSKDITRLILTQIITEDAKTTDSTFPLDLLRQMILTSGRASQETALRYMKAMLDLYQDTYRAMSPAVGPFGMFRPGFGGPVAGRDQPISMNASGEEPTNRAPQETKQVDELKQRVADLERLVSSLTPSKVAQRKPRRSKPGAKSARLR